MLWTLRKKEICHFLKNLTTAVPTLLYYMSTRNPYFNPIAETTKQSINIHTNTFQVI